MPSSRQTVTGPRAFLSQSKCPDKESLCVLYSYRATQRGDWGSVIITAEKAGIKIPLPPNTAAQPHGLARHYSGALLSRRAAPLLLMALQTPDFNNADPELI